MAGTFVSRALGGLALQIPLDRHDYRDNLELFGPETIGFGQDLNQSLLLACAALWLGPTALMRQAKDWLQAYQEHSHLAKYPCDPSFREFTLWLLSTDEVGAAEPLVSNPDLCDPYVALIEGFDKPDSLAAQICDACDYHLYRSDDFPGSGGYPSFYGPTFGLFAAEIFAFAAVRKRVNGIETDLSAHPLLAQKLRDIQPIFQLPDPPFADEIRTVFKHAF